MESQVAQPGIKLFKGLQPWGGVKVSSTGPPQDGFDNDVTGLEEIKPGTSGTGVPGTVNETTGPKGPGEPKPPVTISLQEK
jgi:hypothetical protein